MVKGVAFDVDRLAPRGILTAIGSVFSNYAIYFDDCGPVNQVEHGAFREGLLKHVPFNIEILVKLFNHSIDIWFR